MLLAYEDVGTCRRRWSEIETPIAAMLAPKLDGKKDRADLDPARGQRHLDGMLQLIPVGAGRPHRTLPDPKTLEPVEYFYKVPDQMSDRDVIVVDPMLATGNSRRPRSHA